MSNVNFPIPPSHRTFNFQPIIISSDFDSGNCCNAEKVGNNQFHLWISTDNPKNNYRTWFYFSVQGPNKGATLSFTLKNMQNQSRLLNQGLVPVYRQQGSNQWRRVSQKVNTSAIEYNEGWIQWTFKHNFKSSQKHYFAFFYPWSNEENAELLNQVQLKAKENPEIYCYRGSIIKSIQGRSVQFLVISSLKNKINKQDQFNDQLLFKNQKKPHGFTADKPGIVISARVHPGELPGSHVMTGIIKTLIEKDGIGKLLRDQFVFYIFPILNPDGVARGHYRVDTNGINLNRCYINPSPKQQPSIYAIRKTILHLHSQNRFFSFLDLHAHAARKGTFIYGNCSNQLMKQIRACIFPKLLSMNSIDFEYEGSNFTQKNMYSKDRGDHISKEGSGRVAMFKATKNPSCWTMQCNYNISRVNNVLQKKKNPDVQKLEVDENSLDSKLIVQYKQLPQTDAKQFFTIATYHKLGRQVCQTFLDLVQKNPQSRIDNPQNYFKSVINVKINLAVALLRMAPNRFQPTYKKIYSGITGSQNSEISKNSLKALYFMIIKNAKIPNINDYVKNGDSSLVILPQIKKQVKKTVKVFRSRETKYTMIKSSNLINQCKVSNEWANDQNKNISQCQYLLQQEQFRLLVSQKQQNNQAEAYDNNNYNNDEAQSDDLTQNPMQNNNEVLEDPPNIASAKVLCLENQQPIKKVTLKLEQFRMIRVNKKIGLLGQQTRDSTKSYSSHSRVIVSQQPRMFSKIKAQQLPFLGIQKQKQQVKKIQMIRKGPSFKDQFLFIA